MKRKIIVLLIMGIVSTVLADNYRILLMNTKRVKIGNRSYKEGEVFSCKGEPKISWTNDKQAIKVMNLNTKEIWLFTKPKTNNIFDSIWDFFVRLNPLSTRGIDTLEELGEELSNKTFILMDSIYIESPIPLDKTCHYYVVYKQNDKEVKKRLSTKDDCFVIDQTTISEDRNIDNISLSVYFSKEGIDEDYHLTDSMKISVIPLFLQE